MTPKTPIQCIGFLPDGNRRWAKAQGLPTAEGHRKGLDMLLKAVSWAREAGIPHVVIYAFSTENWNRSEEEVSSLMQLFKVGLKELQKYAGESVAIKLIGERSRFDAELQSAIDQIESASRKQHDCTVWLGLSYGGRAEIVAAANRAIGGGEKVTEDSFGDLLWTAGMPDPDLIIRTGGEKRLSNFLPWQSIYSELFFTDTLWPDFNREEFQGILEAYGTRTRRKGK